MIFSSVLYLSLPRTHSWFYFSCLSKDLLLSTKLLISICILVLPSLRIWFYLSTCRYLSVKELSSFWILHASSFFSLSLFSLSMRLTLSCSLAWLKIFSLFKLDCFKCWSSYTRLLKSSLMVSTSRLACRDCCRYCSICSACSLMTPSFYLILSWDELIIDTCSCIFCWSSNTS